MRFLLACAPSLEVDVHMIEGPECDVIMTLKCGRIDACLHLTSEGI